MATTLLRRYAALGFVGLTLVYVSNPEFVASNDCTATVFMPVVWLEAHDATITQHNAPFMFVGGQERYYLSATRWPGHYVNNYGPVPALLLLGPLAALRSLTGDLREQAALVWQAGKACAALAAAASAVPLFFLAAQRTSLFAAVLAALSYSLGTVVWPMASQAPFQQSFALPFLTLGMWLAAQPRSAFGCGAVLSVASILRGTLLLDLLCVGIGKAREPRQLAHYALGALPPLAALAAYNQSVFGTPWGVGQVQRAAHTWHGDAFQTPFWTGLAGLMVSPSRGLLVYSPVLLFSLYGVWRLLRDPAWQPLRPFIWAAVPIIGICSKWSAWWGGFSYGPRLLLEVLPIACLCLAPAWERVRASRLGSAAFSLTFASSIAAAALGAYAYDVIGWDARTAYAVVDPSTSAATLFYERNKAEQAARERAHVLAPLQLDVDNASHRHRLWRVRDSPLRYYATHFNEARARRLYLMALASNPQWSTASAAQ